MVTSRIWFTAAQKAELWERWKNGQSAAAISRALGGERHSRHSRSLAAAMNPHRAAVSRVASKQLKLFDRFGCRISCSPVPESRATKITPKSAPSR
jgi:hypothetical protein